VSLEGAFRNGLKDILLQNTLLSQHLLPKFTGNILSSIRGYVVEHYRLAAKTAISEKGGD
jgi:hypothetical protein